MNIVHADDREANFIQAANSRLKSKAILSLKVIETNIDGMTLHIGQQAGQFGYGYQYDIVLKKNNKSVAVVMLNSCNDLNMVSGRYHNRIYEVFEPHCYTSKAYRGRGYVESIYRWLLNSGLVFLSCGRQTAGSFGLWQKLGKDYGIRKLDIRYMRYVEEHQKISVHNSWIVTVLGDHMPKEADIKIVLPQSIRIDEPMFG